jgi:hypothetical protein
MLRWLYIIISAIYLNYNPFLSLIIEYFYTQYYAKTHDAGIDYNLSMAQLWCSGFTPIDWYTALRLRSTTLKNTKK